MTEYICKCGRKVDKSTKADNTGNRETFGCDGCPYLMPWGPTRWDDTRRSFVYDVQGYECRMSQRLEYATEIIGRADDKCTMHIDSLDFDFLGRVQAWIKEHYQTGEISSDFNPELMRACQYVSDGRYRMSISCAQNKAGMAAKNELMREFFDSESKRRLDMTPEEEKHKILGDIDRGKELGKGPDAEAIADQDWEEDAKNMSTVYVDSDGRLYRVGILNAGNSDREKYTIFALGVEPGSQWRKLKNSPEYFRPQQCDPEGCAKHALNVLAMSRGLKPADDETARCNENARGDPGPVKPGMTDEEAEAAVLSEDIGLTGPTRAAEEAAATEPTDTAAPASGDDLPQPCIETVPEQCKTCTCVDCGVAICNGGPQGCRYKQDANGNCAVYDGDLASRAVCGYSPCAVESTAEAPASGDEQYPDWLPSAAKELADLMRNEHGIDPLKATAADFRKFYGNPYTGRGGPQIPGFACTPKGVALSFDSFGKNKQVNFTWLDFVAYLRSVLSAPEPSAASEAEQPEAQTAKRPEPVAETAAIAAPETAPAAFDYSGMDDFTKCSLQFLALRIDQTRARAFMDIATDLKRAHDAIAKKGYGCFDAWCQSIGISKGTSFNMLRVATEYERSNLNERKVLAALPKSMLYAITSSSAPAEAVEAVKAGDVTTMPEYKALLDQLARKDEAIKTAQEANEQNRVRANNAENDYDAAVQRAEIAERRAREAEAQRKNLQEAEAAHAAKIRELESRPVDVAVRKPTDAEIEQYRQEGYARAQKELAQTAAQNDDIAGDIADHAETVADSCAEALAGWFRLANNLDDDAYTTAVRYLKRLCVDLHDAIVNGAWPTSGDDDDDGPEEDEE